MKRWLPLLIVVLTTLPFLRSFQPPRENAVWRLEEFGRLPVLQGGRIKPLDTVARNSLLVIHGSQTLREEGRKIRAIEWLVEVMSEGAKADQRPIFRIYDEDILGMIHQEPGTKKYFSFQELTPHWDDLQQAAVRASEVEAPKRSRFQKAVLQLVNCAHLYQSLKNTLFLDGGPDPEEETEGFLQNLETARVLWLQTHGRTRPGDATGDGGLVKLLMKRHEDMMASANFLPLPPLPGEHADQWRSTGQAFAESIQGADLHPEVSAYARIIGARKAGDAARFNEAVVAILERHGGVIREVASRMTWELRFNRSQPFYQAILVDVIAVLLIVVSWIVAGPLLTRSAAGVVFVGFLIHSFGLFMRIVLQGRPPVTNLYSSAVFVGWVAVLIGLFLERIFKNGFAALGAAIVGGVTLVIAHHLSMGGDTMEMMQAVLDSNFWLSTHVVTITIGYGSAFVAGILAHIGIVRRFIHGGQADEAWTRLARMTYGVVCFSLFLSFVGTTLGGIWADQSWGRFWGWDPKENGALLIVLWFAITLHARLAGAIRERGMLVMAVFGCIVTSFSWFGVNMLGIGLHSYGFMDKAFYWLAGFMVLELGFMVLGCQPLARSQRAD